MDDTESINSSELIEKAVFGKEIEFFLASRIGQYIIKRADNYADEAMELLKKVDPKDESKIRELQNRIWIAESIQQWLADALTDGYQALTIIEDA